MSDAIIISDLHLGSRICQAKLISQFLHQLNTKELILNGDVFDSFDLRPLKKHHWKVICQLRKLAKKIKVVWIIGNHDGPTNNLSTLLGIEVLEEYVLINNNTKILILHGHQFDNFMNKHPMLTHIGDFIYHMMQRVDPSFWIARNAKKMSKLFLRNAKKVKTKAVAYAKKKKCDIVITGHTHKPESLDNYYNSGSWAELPAHYIEITDGIITLKEFNKLCKFTTDSAASVSDTLDALYPSSEN